MPAPPEAPPSEAPPFEAPPPRPRTLLEKLWTSHEVPAGTAEEPAILYVDLHLLHEVTSPQAFAELAARGLPVRRPERCLATMDHSTPTRPGSSLATLMASDPRGAAQLATLAANCARHGIPLFPLGSPHQGIVHVMGPELGATQPGMTIVCGDSHTSTHGAFGALAFGIGTSEVAHVLASQCLLQQRPKSFAVRWRGTRPPGVTAKDMVLDLIARCGVDAGTGHVFEYGGEAVDALSMEERMTICNMSIEAGARAGLIAPDETTFAYLAGRPLAPAGADWERALERWRQLPSDPGAVHDREETIDAARLAPMITYGTNPGMGIPIDGRVPAAHELPTAARPAFARALAYMRLDEGEEVRGKRLDVVFLGSCTNSRLSDLRAAAALLAGKRIAPHLRMLVVPGSEPVRRQAEAEGLAEIFRAAGAEWRQAGCSMCLAMNEDRLAPGELALSTSNRNFEGRQGPGGRTFLASPLTAAASALAGAVADPRELLA